VFYSFKDLINKSNTRDYNINKDYKRFSNLDKSRPAIL